MLETSTIDLNYKIFITSIYLLGMLSGGIIGAIVLAVKEVEERKRNE